MCIPFYTSIYECDSFMSSEVVEIKTKSIHTEVHILFFPILLEERKKKQSFVYLYVTFGYSFA